MFSRVSSEPLTHTYSVERESRSASSISPTAWMARAVSSSMCVSRGSPYRADHRSRTTTRYPAWPSIDAATSPVGP